MKLDHPPYYPVKGKTYTLFGNSDSTRGYYSTIKDFADKIINEHPDLQGIIDGLERLSGKKRTLKRVLKKVTPATITEEIVRMIDPELRKYTEDVEQHLKTLPLSKFWDRRLATSRIQYHLYMLEIELTNRLFIKDFIKADLKIALMPYC